MRPCDYTTLALENHKWDTYINVKCQEQPWRSQIVGEGEEIEVQRRTVSYLKSQLESDGVQLIVISNNYKDVKMQQALF